MAETPYTPKLLPGSWMCCGGINSHRLTECPECGAAAPAPVSEAVPTPDEMHKHCLYSSAGSHWHSSALCGTTPLAPAGEPTAEPHCERCGLEAIGHDESPCKWTEADVLRQHLRELRARVASLTTDRTALATLREAARSIPEDADEFCRLFAGQPATAPQHAAFMRTLADSLTALRAMTADHEEGGT